MSPLWFPPDDTAPCLVTFPPSALVSAAGCLLFQPQAGALTSPAPGAEGAAAGQGPCRRPCAGSVCWHGLCVHLSVGVSVLVPAVPGRLPLVLYLCVSDTVQSTPVPRIPRLSALSPSWGLAQAFPEEGSFWMSLPAAERQVSGSACCAGVQVQAVHAVCLPLLLLSLPPPLPRWAGAVSSLARLLASEDSGTPLACLCLLSARAETEPCSPDVAGLPGLGDQCTHRALLGVRISGTT